MNPLGQRIGLVFALTLLGIVGAFLVELFLSASSDRHFGHTQRGHVVGWVGLAVIMLVFVYSLKKRYGMKLGTPKGWLHVHILAGVLGPLLILVHSGAHFHALVPLVTMGIMAIVVISGIVGQAIHVWALRTLNQQRRRFIEEGLPPDMVDERLDELASEEELFRWWRAIHAPFTITFVVLVAWHVLGALYFGGL
ncbi:hypothetical protein [Petrachloros mirabilis]